MTQPKTGNIKIIIVTNVDIIFICQTLKSHIKVIKIGNIVSNRPRKTSENLKYKCKM